MVVSFTVYKSSKYLFDCTGSADISQSKQPCPTVDLHALEALRLNAVDVVKRMGYVEVDKMIASCAQHPPQTVVVPATHGDIVPFQEFTKYLKARQRAGVALLAEGRLLILSPLENEDLQLRCVVASAKPCKNASAAAPPYHATTANANEATAGQHLQTKVHSQAAAALSSPLPESRIEKHRQSRVRSCNRGSTQLEKVVDTVHRERCNEQNRHGQAEVRASTPVPDKELPMLCNLSRLERATQIARFRQEHEAFHKHYHGVLQEWSKSNVDG
ncbi:unnamed protein product [Hyaloperonospora brassicae]|uniref:Spen paralogue and orthologue SPOC C-terminal domain-containing protein n=1 Tax=Hyaloperonospora brassicae TaxID=162125 RepID=A0AAV0UMM6_HYABA|nr:unnamed protein product [Hyaloperonospora brassicae]